MGSTGTGSFGNYFPGSDSKNLCDKAIAKVILEDVAQSEYFQNHNSVPSVGDDIKVREELLNGRIVVETVLSGEVIGALPTKYNYLLACMRGGKFYSGKVLYSHMKPIPTVEVNLYAY